MSDTPTPRTDAHLEGLRKNPELSGCGRTLAFARELERENARLNEERQNWRVSSVCRELEEQNKRLRTAGKALRDALAFECHKIGDCPREIDEWDALCCEAQRLRSAMSENTNDSQITGD